MRTGQRPNQRDRSVANPIVSSATSLRAKDSCAPAPADGYRIIWQAGIGRLSTIEWSGVVWSGPRCRVTPEAISPAPRLL
jgi:hypothetical protein